MVGLVLVHLTEFDNETLILVHNEEYAVVVHVVCFYNESLVQLCCQKVFDGVELLPVHQTEFDDVVLVLVHNEEYDGVELAVAHA